MKPTTRHAECCGKKDASTRSTDCKAVRGRVQKLLDRWLGADALWVQRHIANCPRCQKRFVGLGKVNLALSLLRSQPHKLDLMARANMAAVNVLKHSTRESEKACDLKVACPKPTLWEQLGKYSHVAGNLAACILLITLMKIGIISSMGTFSSKGHDAMEHYYAAQAGQDMADEIFTA